MQFTVKQSIALTAICMTSLMFGLEISSVPVILPSLQAIMKGDFAQLQWVMNAYTIACTTVLMATGTLADRYGRKRLYILSTSLFGLTSLACGLSTAVSWLIVSRFLQGIGGGAMLICQISVLADQFRGGKERAFAFGMWGIVFGAGLGFGPVIGGMIMSVSSWKWIFLIHVPISLVALALILGGVEGSKGASTGRLDWAGMVLLAVAVFGLTFFITQGNVAVMVVAVFSFWGFLRVERRSAYPMFDFSVFRIRSFSGALLGSMGMNFSFWPFMIYFPLYFQHVLGYDVRATGLSLLAYTLPTLVVPPVAERMALRYRAGVVIPLGLFVIGLGFFGMWWAMGLSHANWVSMLPGSLLAGIGLGLTNTPVTNTTTSSIPAEKTGMATGIDTSARLITLAINIALMGFILVAGIHAYLAAGTGGGAGDEGLRQLSEQIAAGTIDNVPALVQGFQWVVLYAGIGVWLLAAGSFWIFISGHGFFRVSCSSGNQKGGIA